jgi:hypothetical protein
MFTSQLGDMAAMKKRAEVAAIPDIPVAKRVVSTPVPAPVVKKKGGRPRKAK